MNDKEVSKLARVFASPRRCGQIWSFSATHQVLTLRFHEHGKTVSDMVVLSGAKVINSSVYWKDSLFSIKVVEVGHQQRQIIIVDDVTGAKFIAEDVRVVERADPVMDAWTTDAARR